MRFRKAPRKGKMLPVSKLEGSKEGLDDSDVGEPKHRCVPCPADFICKLEDL